jgi:hypothetical protein
VTGRIVVVSDGILLAILLSSGVNGRTLSVTQLPLEGRRVALAR